jgi:hypothetical protein
MYFAQPPVVLVTICALDVALSNCSSFALAQSTLTAHVLQMDQNGPSVTANVCETILANDTNCLFNTSARVGTT